MSDAMELKDFTDNNNVSGDQTIEVIPGNGACTYQIEPEAEEGSRLLSTPQVTGNNREQHTEDEVYDTDSETSKWRRELQSLKTELNEEVVWKLRLWVVLLLIFLFIALVIGISVIVCLVSDDDGDDNYDKSSFVVERIFRGNFTLNNSSFISFSLDQVSEQLEQQLTGVYSSSPALERYFSNVIINPLQDTTAQFKLQFMMPSEHEELVRYTLSLKMVKNVLLQHLYDNTGESPYIIPTSLRIEVG